jgi:hypothetical protein
VAESLQSQKEIETLLTEFHVSGAMLAALLLSLLEKKGLLDHDEVAEAIREAADGIPRQLAAEPRFGALTALRIFLDDPEMRHMLPFTWHQSEAKPWPRARMRRACRSGIIDQDNRA